MENEVTTYMLESDILCKYVYHIGVTKVRKYEQITKEEYEKRLPTVE